MTDKKYYEAYDERYKTAHSLGMCWFSDTASPILSEIIQGYMISKCAEILEIGCGEGRDAYPLLKSGYRLLASDVSLEAIQFCRAKWSSYRESFQVVDCVKDELRDRYDFIYAIAVLHMLVSDEDRDAFYSFIHRHLKENGIALICSMGDGQDERASDVKTAFDLQERECRGKKLLVAGTSCRIVSSTTFKREIERNGFSILQTAITSIPNEFSSMLYAVIQKNE